MTADMKFQSNTGGALIDEVIAPAATTGAAIGSVVKAMFVGPLPDDETMPPKIVVRLNGSENTAIYVHADLTVSYMDLYTARRDKSMLEINHADLQHKFNLLAEKLDETLDAIDAAEAMTVLQRIVNVFKPARIANFRP